MGLQLHVTDSGKLESREVQAGYGIQAADGVQAGDIDIHMYIYIYVYIYVETERVCVFEQAIRFQATMVLRDFVLPCHSYCLEVLWKTSKLRGRDG